MPASRRSGCTVNGASGFVVDITSGCKVDTRTSGCIVDIVFIILLCLYMFCGARSSWRGPGAKICTPGTYTRDSCTLDSCTPDISMRSSLLWNASNAIGYIQSRTSSANGRHKRFYGEPSLTMAAREAAQQKAGHARALQEVWQTIFKLTCWVPGTNVSILERERARAHRMRGPE